MIDQKLQQHNQDIENRLVSILKDEFTLYQDLKIIQIMQREKVNYKHFVMLSHQIESKTTEQLRLRYIHQLKYLQQEDFDLIENFIQQHNLLGMLRFKDNKLQEIVKIELTTQTNTIGIQTDQIEEAIPLKKRKLNEATYNSKSYELSDLVIENLFKDEIIHQELRFPTNSNLSQQLRLQQEQYQNYLHDLCLWYGISLEKMKEYFYQCSGNFDTLKSFLIAKTNVIWKKEEDALLISGKIPPNRQISEIEKRRKWLCID